MRLDAIRSAFLERWEAQRRCGEEPSRLLPAQAHADHSHLAVDGKALRATRSQEAPVQQLSCYEGATGRVLWHCNVQEKHNELSELKPFLITPWVKGRLLSLDALHTSARVLSAGSPPGGRRCLDCQRQPADLSDEDGNTPRPGTRGHGRLEHRQITCSRDLNDWFANDWQGIAQVFGLERTVRVLTSGEVRHEVVSGRE